MRYLCKLANLAVIKERYIEDLFISIFVISAAHFVKNKKIYLNKLIFDAIIYVFKLPGRD